MRRVLLGVPLALAALLMAAPAAFAQNAHFISANASLSGTNVVVSWKEAGLGNNQNITYTTSANATETVVCVNGGGANPSASNKTTISGPVSASGTFNSGKNGSITGSLTLSPPTIPSSFSCPKGQKEATASVSYTGVTLADTTNSISVSLGDFSTGCLLPNVKGACS
jgi:hypothetical protein